MPITQVCYYLVGVERRLRQQCVFLSVVVFVFLLSYIESFILVFLPRVVCCLYIVQLSTSGRNDVVIWICLIFIAIQTLMITVQMPTTYSRDQLLMSLRACATKLNHHQRLRITQLGLRRRGCRAGNHTHRSRQAARSAERRDGDWRRRRRVVVEQH